MTTLQILYHGHCYDGVTSAAVFKRFYTTCIDAKVDVRYRGMAHRREDPFGSNHDATFDADVNVVVDFRYSPSPRLTWWCDHHLTAFMNEADRRHFETNPNRRHCFDASAPSCTGLLVRWLTKEYGFDASALNDHIYWAELIDSARFVDAKQAVELEAPALQLMMLLESAPAAKLEQAMIDSFSARSIEETYRDERFQRAIGPILEQHRSTIDCIRTRMKVVGRVGFFDLSDDAVTGFNKFIPYYLEGNLDYTVGVTKTPTRAKISVGSNPWKRPSSPVNLATLCGRYGGGGHEVVAAVSLPPEELPQAKRYAQEMLQELTR